MVEHPLSERVAWRAVWRLLLALSALLLAGWSVGAADHNPWTPAAVQGGSVPSALMLTPAADPVPPAQAHAVAALPAVWSPPVAGAVRVEPADRSAAITAQAADELSPPAWTGVRSGMQVVDFDGLSIVLAVLALLALVTWRRRDQVLR